MKVQTRLLLAFGILVALMLFILAVAVTRLAELNDGVGEMAHDRWPKVVLANDSLDQLSGIAIALRNMALTDSHDDVQAQKAAVLAHRARIGDNLEALRKVINLPKGVEMLDGIVAVRSRYVAGQERYFEMIEGGRQQEALAYLRQELRPLLRDYTDRLRAFTHFQGELMDQTARQADERYRLALYVMLGVGILAVLLALLVSRAIARGLMRQLGGEPGDAVAAALRVAEGDLSHTIVVQPDDQDSIMAAMARMQTALNAFVQRQEDLARRHAQGAIGARLDAARFPGAYGRMAEQANQLAASHIAVYQEMVAVIARYAEGDFSVDMSRLPGEKARITESVDQVKAALLTISTEIKNLAYAGARGDFGLRGDAGRFDFMFRQMIGDLNTLVDTCDVGFHDILRIAECLSRGDLSQTIAQEYPGLFGQTRDGVNDTVENLRELVSHIQEVVAAIHTAAREIASGNADLSSRTESQASSLEETASSMEELTATVQQNAQSALAANGLAAEATQVARQGGEAVRRTVDTMTGIADASHRIANIIGVIDGIAFQTNILALNAAVEAARAGEQGHGFAVVATEVRVLAQRSSAAAHEIKSLIAESAARVAGGVEHAENAGLAMDKVISAVERMAGLIGEISDASVEQSSGIGQINTAVMQMDEMTQQNAALVEQAAAAAENLQDQAQRLAEAIAVFRLDTTPAERALTVRCASPSPA